MKNESGFSAIAVVFVILTMATISFAGWKVWQTSADPTHKTSNNTASSTTKKSENPVEVNRTVPNGYMLYENKDIGFSFYYPEYWGVLSPKSPSASELDLEGPEIPTSDHDELKLSLWSDKTSEFKSRTTKKNVTYSPEANGDNYAWKYAASAYGLQIGDIADPQPPLLSHPKIKVYQIEGGHACESEMTYLFPVKNNFIGVKINYGSCYVLHTGEISQDKTAQFNKAYEKLKQEIDDLPSTFSLKD